MVMIRFELKGLQEMQAQLARLSGLQLGEMLASVGSLVENQTKKRLGSGGPAPDGKPWAKWSKEYAKTRHGNHKILLAAGMLKQSITNQVQGNAVAIGTSLPYAAIHQFGGKIAHAAQSRKVRFRVTAKGERIKQSALGMGPHRRGTNNLMVFAKNKHKRAAEAWVSRPAYSVAMPARPFLGLSRSDETEVMTLVQKIVRRMLP
jgi:phage virion morphogenesis protein